MKRIFDILLAGVLFGMLSPLFVVIAIAIRVKLGSPIIFRQVRPGLGGELFTMVKFRSMLDAKYADGKLLPDAERLTKFGRFLRASSLDELPELWNVLRGEMSMVGPRPLLVEYLPLYSAEQARRHNVRPGITGWAQVNGRNALSWDEKFKLDVWYVEHQSLLIDIKILLLTVVSVFKKSGINNDGHATMPMFSGKPRPDEE